MANKITKFKFNFKKNYWYDLFWSYKSKILWTWLDVDDISKYNFWDNVKYINWKITAKKNGLFVNRFIDEKSLKVNFFVDVSYWMNFWSSDLRKIDILLETLYIFSECWINNWDILNWFLFDKEIYRVESKVSKNLFSIMLKKLENIAYINEKRIDKIVDFVRVNKFKNNVIFIFTDEINFDNYADLLKTISLNNKVIIVNIFDYLEINPCKNLVFNIWKNSFLSKDAIKIKTKIENNKKLLLKNSIDNIIIDTKSDIYKEIYKYLTSKTL